MDRDHAVKCIVEGMALDLSTCSEWPAPATHVEVGRVDSPDAFSRWIDVVNEALHGWDLLDPEHYRPWLDGRTYDFYLAYLDGRPVSTVATLRDGDRASVEFVSTLAPYRRRGAAMAACTEALRRLQEHGVLIATLRSSPEAVPLYTRLGFEPCYEQVLVSYQRHTGGA